MLGFVFLEMDKRNDELKRMLHRKTPRFGDQGVLTI